MAEVAAVAEHVASLTTAAAALQVRPDVPDGTGDGGAGAIVPLRDERGDPEAAAVLAEIRAWAGEALGVDRAPAIWRALAHRPRLLAATWRKDGERRSGAGPPSR